MAQIATTKTGKAAAEATKAATHPRAADVARDLTDKAQGTTLRLIEKRRQRPRTGSVPAVGYRQA